MDQALARLARPQVDLAVLFELFQANLLTRDLGRFKSAEFLPQHFVLLIKGLPSRIMLLEARLELLEHRLRIIPFHLRIALLRVDLIL